MAETVGPQARYDGKVALVTGASRGIGRALALSMADLGADVIVTARTVEARSDLAGTIVETAEAVRARGRRAWPVAADLTAPGDVDALLAAAAGFGGVDVLVNNAAAMQPEMYDSLWAMTAPSWRYQLELNLTVPWVLTQRCALAMRSRGGGLVNITSGPTGHSPNPDVVTDDARVGAAYLVSKVGVTQLTAALAPELAEFGIAVLALHPSHTRTENGLRLGPVGGYRMDRGHDIDLPVAVFEHLLTHDPAARSGQVVFAPDYAREHGLLG